MKFRLHSIYFRIFLSIWLTVMVFAMTPIALLVGSSADVREGLSEFARKMTSKNIVSDIRTAAGSGNLKDLRKAVEKASESLNTHIYVFDSGKKQLFEKEHPAEVFEILSQLQDDTLVAVKKYSRDPADNRMIRIMKAGGFIIIGYPTQYQETPPVMLLLTQHVHIILYVIFLSSIASFFIVKTLSGPLTTVGKAAKKIAEGDFSVRVADKLKRKDELGMLANDFDFMAEKLETTRQTQRGMIRNISHELRSPLTRLLLSLELARAKSDPANAQALDRIEKEAEKLNEMITNLLEVSKIHSAASIQTETACLYDVIRDILADAEFEAESYGKKLSFSVDKNIQIRCHKRAFVSALENVIRNAVSYARSQVTVSAEQTNENAVITVCDDGKGVEEELLENIFVPFFRVDDTRDRKTGGTGLGLSIAMAVVTAHSGKIRAYNTQKGGLCVEISMKCV